MVSTVTPESNRGNRSGKPAVSPAGLVEAGEAAIPRGEVLLELLESTYVAFGDRVEAIKRHTTCQCNACRLIRRSTSSSSCISVSTSCRASWAA